MGAIGGIADFKKREIDFAELNRMRLAMSMRGRKRSSAYIGGTVDMIYNSSSADAFEEGEDKQPAIFERSASTYVVSQDSDLLSSSALFESYRTEGRDFVGGLRGGFAISLFDAERQMLMLARDRKGKKPLFYKIYNGKIYFASEIKGIFEAVSKRVPISREMLSLHITAPMGVYGASNIFLDIFEVLPGECIIFTALGISRLKYRDHSSREHTAVSRRNEKKDRVFTAYPIDDCLRIEDALLESLIAFDYPQFDSNMPALCKLFESARNHGYEKIFFGDSVRRQSLFYAYEREDRLGSFYGIRAEGRMLRTEPTNNTEPLRAMHEYLYGRLLSMDEGQISLLKSILGSHKLCSLTERLADVGENEKDTDARIRILGMLIQTVMWAESRELLIVSSSDRARQSALSIT
ncbi:MAG: hypothetical protein J6L85_00225 [Clostridia bacterium]|nr:hypothetical protein [Clostridia bacterium]